jgi:hypothetical protein
MQHDEIGRDAGGALVEKWRKNLFDADHQAGSDIDAHGCSSRPSCHTSVPQ